MFHNRNVYGKLSLITFVQIHIGKPSIVAAPKMVAGIRGLASLEKSIGSTALPFGLGQPNPVV